MRAHRVSPRPFGARGGLLVCLAVLLIAGCSGGGELGKKEDAELRNNFTRKLNPEEIARLGGAKPVDGPQKGK